MAYSDEIRQQAKRLFLRGVKPSEIKQQLNLATTRIIYYWASKESWADLLAFDNPVNAVSRRINRLYEKIDLLTDREHNELFRLIKQRDQLVKQIAKPLQDEQGAKKSKGWDSTTKRVKKGIKNDISSITQEMLEAWFDKNLFGYQKQLLAAKNDPSINRNRNCLKSRQIGLTWYFAREAFADAVISGDNQIFLSASKSQARMFRFEIIAFAKELGVELKGNDQIELSNGAVLYFLSTNSNTAQSYHGHLYIDEYFWIPKFKKLQTVASGMASQKKWRRTYFSTPSTLTHEAYSFWSGDDFKNQKTKKASLPWPSDLELHNGALCPDGTWRIIIDIDDAQKGGCDLFDIEQLKIEYAPDIFNQLFKCQFIDEAQGVFKLEQLEQCLSDYGYWSDFDPHAVRPFGDKPVWIGYDPSRNGDMASCVVLAVPDTPGGKFRILEILQLRGQSFVYQAEQIKRLTTRYNVEHIGVDITGMGYGVYDIIKSFFRKAMAIHYSLETKTALVLKAQDVVVQKRLQWDATKTEIAAAFLTIKKTTTGNGNITFSSNRTATTGHADIAWATMHALYKEPFNVEKLKNRRRAKVSAIHK